MFERGRLAPVILRGFFNRRDGGRLVVPLQSFELNNCGLGKMTSEFLWKLFCKRQ